MNIYLHVLRVNVLICMYTRYPVCGNTTVRTVHEDDFQIKRGLSGKSTYTVPKGTPIHIPMFSLHNTTRTWGEEQGINKTTYYITLYYIIL